ncbi:MAG: Tfp pilus assembly protein PilN [Hyphomicrobiaceae bacterium]
MEARSFIQRFVNVDIADALGIVIGSQSISIAHLTKRIKAVSVGRVATEALEGPPEAHAAEITSWLRRAAENGLFEAARVAIVVDRSATLFAQLQVPSAAAENISEVVGYELDRLFPVPPDSLYYDVLVRPVGSVGERVAVTVVAIPRNIVDAAVAAVKEAGLPVAAVTVEPAALADFAGYVGRSSGNLFSVFSRSEGREYITLAAGGMLVSSHRVHGNSSREELTAREIDMALPERSGEDAVIVATTPEATSEVALADLGWAEGLAFASTPNAQEIVAAGAALGRLGESGGAINLLPADMVQKASGLGMREVSLSIAVLFLALGLFVTSSIKDHSIASALDSELLRLTPRVNAVAEREDKNSELLGKVEGLETLGRSKVTAYLREATRLIPKNAWLTAFRFRGDRIDMDGIAKKASGLIAVLEASPYFNGVEFTAPVTKFQTDLERFSVRVRLER